MAIGTVLLLLPIAREPGMPADLVVALFTATSAVCVTGLAVVDTATYWSPFGEVVLLSLVQIGGFGFMTGSTLLLLLLIRRRTGLRDRILVQASTGTSSLEACSRSFGEPGCSRWWSRGSAPPCCSSSFLVGGRDILQSAWYGVFHSVAAFNNAGFDLFGGFRSLADYATNPVVLVTIGILIVLGGLGVAIVGRRGRQAQWSRLALETKVVLLTTLVLLVGGAVVLGALEWSNPATLGAIPSSTGRSMPCSNR